MEERAPLAACLDGEALLSVGAGALVGAVVLEEVESIERKSKPSTRFSMARAGSGEEPEEAGGTTEPTPTQSIPYKRSPILVAAEEGGGGRGGGG